MKQILIPFNEMNLNGRVYTKDSIKNIPDNIICYLGQGDYPRSLDSAIGTAKVTQMEDGLYAEVKLFKDFDFQANFGIIPVGKGKVNNGIVSDYSLDYISLDEQSVYSWSGKCDVKKND